MNVIDDLIKHHDKEHHGSAGSYATEPARAELAQLRAELAQAVAQINAAHVYLNESPVNSHDDPPLELADRIAGVVNQLIECRAQLAVYQRREALRQ